MIGVSSVLRACDPFVYHSNKRNTLENGVLDAIKKTKRADLNLKKLMISSCIESPFQLPTPLPA